MRKIVIATSLGAALLAGGVNDAHGRSRTAPACVQLRKLRSVFPAATTVGLTWRSAIKIQPARAPVFAGRCGAFWTTYKGPDGKTVDVEVTLYKTAKSVSAPLAEPMMGGVHVLPNGARVRTSGPDPGSVNGTPSSSTSAASAFRRIFIESVSISTSLKPLRISGHLRIHRLIENRFAGLGAGH
jgi:hypothetical protein